MKSYNSTYLRDENLLSLLSLNNLIVPEIQREYVWGKAENKIVLEKFLKNIQENVEVCNECKQVHSDKDFNIGFLYSYKPSYITVDNERYLDEFLIDGQQRFTTLFLLLSYLAIKEKRDKDFLTLVRFDRELEIFNFDYKVRDLTHRFLIDYLSSFKENVAMESIIPHEYNGRWRLPHTWFLSDYYNDITVQAMLGTLYTISTIFNTEYEYFDYILKNIRFWHFKTEATSQGEELYITMNSRGERLSKNEEQKANILPEDQLIEWGKKWEEWQDFFWKNRSNNPSADKGFNEFLYCIAGLSQYNNERKYFITKEDFDKKGIDINLSNEIFGLSDIEDYYLSLLRLYDTKSEYDWLNHVKKEMQKVINLETTNWFADYTDEDRGTERNRMVFVWFILDILKANKDSKQLTLKEVRALRFIWVRYNNYERSVTSIKSFVKEWLGSVHNNKWTEEEKLKYSYLCTTYDEPIKCEEEIIWKIEDHPLNINGQDIGGINISHLVDFDSDPSFEELSLIYQKFCKLFPEKDCSCERELKSLLLHYKDENGNAFWNRRSPWYYYNYDCSDWRRIIRKDFFRNVFEKIFEPNGNCIVSEILDKKNREFLSQFNSPEDIIGSEMSHRKQLIIYSLLIHNIWELGNIAFESVITEGEFKIFKNESQIYLIKNSFKGEYKDLQNIVENIGMDKKQMIQSVLDFHN